MSKSEKLYDVDPGIEALIRLDGHEKACKERMDRIDRALGAMSSRLWWILGTAIIGACAIAFEIFKQAS